MLNISYKWRGRIDRTHYFFSQFRILVRILILVRNQANQIIKYSLYEDNDPLINSEKWIVERIAPQSSVFIDVGANIGNWTNMFQSHMSRNRKGLLFEPSEFSAEKLRNRFGSMVGIEVIQAAASDSPGRGLFYEEPEGGGMSSLIATWSSPHSETKEIRITTIDSEVNNRHIDFVDFLKIDAEGYDLYVLRGAGQLLSEKRIGFIQFEYGSPWAISGGTLGGAYRFLESFGYQIYLLKDRALLKLRYELYGEYFGLTNFLAVSPAKVPAIEGLVKGSI